MLLLAAKELDVDRCFSLVCIFEAKSHASISLTVILKMAAMGHDNGVA